MSTSAHLCVFLLVCVGIVRATTAAHGDWPKEWTPLDEIRLANVNYKMDLESNNVDKILDMYDPNVIVMPEGYPTFVGKETLAKTLAWVSQVGSTDFKIDELAYLDDLGRLIIERKTSTVLSKAGDTIFDGKSIIIWKWDEPSYSYRIYLQMYNSNTQE